MLRQLRTRQRRYAAPSLHKNGEERTSEIFLRWESAAGVKNTRALEKRQPAIFKIASAFHPECPWTADQGPKVFQQLRCLFFLCAQKSLKLSIPAVAVLVLLAGAAGTILVAADLAPTRGVLRVAVGGSGGDQ